ncbi:1-aminocyclopropane-1-carboxylate deaminase [Pseudomonas asuensis]|uniref:1-aminocyclopropane-1-carboxylate deaminase n=1 Tax=Pseudomonas asuensis TaxID=1825787 RepID=A0ABQ2GR56_9PSED|nr:1-aminocyclopropane-1-carboxylate deaminase [Pseudomonas asuensis]
MFDLGVKEPPLQEVATDWLARAGVRLALLRLDEVDPLVSGNKSYKLAAYLRQARTEGAAGLISLGGAHSNHLHALAAAGRRLDLQTVGLLRGEPQDTPTTDDLRKWKMELHWLGYGGYRARHDDDFWQNWLARYPGYLPIPEGGGGYLGMQGCAPLVAYLQTQLNKIGWSDYDELWVAAGTGTTVAGLAVGESGRHPVVGTLSVPLSYNVPQQVAQWLDDAGQSDADVRWLDASLGGFARIDTALASFMASFEADTQVLLEPLYTGKLLLALRREIEAGHVPPGRRIVAVHTGGLQGRRAMQPRLQTLLEL